MKDLNLLYTFEALWRERSVTLAAESLGVTQAAASSALKRLREEYDDKLFTLVGRRMEPTPLAAALSSQLLDALSLVRKGSSGHSRFDPASSGRLFTIRTRDIGEVICFPPLLAALAQEAPDIRLRAVFLPIEDTVMALANGQIDLALGFLPSLETDIHFKRLFTQHYVCVMRLGHPLGPNPLTLTSIAAHDHLLTEYSGSGHKALERALIDLGLRNRIKVRLPQYLSAPYMICNSDLLWIAPAMLVERLSRHFPLIAKPLPMQLPDFDIGLYWHDRFHRDGASKWLRDFIGKYFAQDAMPSAPDH